MKSFKNFKSVPVVATLAAVAVGGGGAVAFWWWVQRPNFWTGTNPGLELVPQESAMVVSVSTDPQQWQQLQQYGTPQTQGEFQKLLLTWRDRIFTNNGYNYQQDIQPWIGDQVTLAFLTPPSDATLNTGKVESLVAVLPIANPLQAQQALERTNQPKTGQWVESDYQGLQIRELTGNATQKIATTLIGKQLIISNNRQGIEKVIDTFRGKASVAKTPGYQNAVSQLKAQKPFAQVYFNLPAATAIAAARSARSLTPQNLAQAQQRQGLATTISLESQGIRFQSVSWLKPNSEERYTVENKAELIPKRLPNNTLMMVSGGNFAQTWQDYVKSASSNPVLPIPPNTLKQQISNNFGLDIDQDLAPWMNGEYSLALVPTPENNSSGLGAGIVIMAQASDRTRAEQTLQRLDQFMAKQYQFQVQPGDINGKPVVNWTSQFGGLAATHGWLDGNIAFLVLGAPVANSFVPIPQQSFAESEAFKQSVPQDLNPRNGHFFMDIDRTFNAGNMTFPQLPPQQQQFLQGIRSIGVTGAISSDRTSRFDIFVNLKKVSDPVASPSPSPMPSP